MITQTTTANDVGTLYRQGDVLIERLSAKPTARIATRTVSVEAIDGRHVLARGEKTGHDHSLPAQGAVMEVSDDPAREVYLRIMEPTALVHQQHAPIVLDPGTYRVRTQRSYVPGAEPLDVSVWE